MPSSTITTCTLCGLRFSNRALLDLHIREDHLNPNRPAHAERDDTGEENGAPRPPAGGPAAATVPAASPARTAGGAKTATAPRRHVPQAAMTALRRVLDAIRSVSDKRLRAPQATTGSGRAPQASQQPGAQPDHDDQPPSTTRPGDRTA
jgi:hypothetical protein